MDRRSFLMNTVLRTTAASASLALISAVSQAAEDKPTIGIGFSLYGMRTLPLAEALRACREIGYDNVELPVMADWPADSARFSDAEVDRFRGELRETGLHVSALMDNLTLLAAGDAHAANLRRIEAAGRLAHRIGVVGSPPVIETILGGRPAEWSNVRDAMVERLKEWAKAADNVGAMLAFKPHVAGAVHTPEDAVWLWERVAHPRIKIAFDFSHYQLRDRKLGDCLDRLLDKTAFVHVKDAQGTADKFQFLLPGEGTIDYSEYFRRLSAGGYRGDVVVEVSGQIHSRKDYNPLDAAKRSFAPLATAARQAGLRSQ